MTDLSTDATVLVTGANGFVGSRVCRHLVAAGVDVRALVRRADADLDEAGDVDVAVAALDDPASLADALAGVTHVVHCAAVAGPDQEAAAAVNVAGTRSVLEAAAAAGVERVVHVSTTSVVAEDAAVVDEDAPLVGDDAGPYPLTKRDAEAVAAEVARDTDLDVVVVRPPAVLGWGPTSTWGQRVPAWVASEDMPFRPDPRAHLGWVHVDDLAAAIDSALTTAGASGRTYVVAAGRVTWEAYLGTVAGWFPDVAAPFDRADVPPSDRTWSADRAREELGWTPTRTFDDALAEIAERHR